MSWSTCDVGGLAIISGNANFNLCCTCPCDLSSSNIVHLRGPDVLPHAFDPVPKLIDTAIPIPQTASHTVNLLHIQDLRLHPIDPSYSRDLVDTALQQSQAQGLHDQDLNVLWLDVRFLRYGAESHCAVVGRAAEDGFGKSTEGDLLGEKVLVGGEER